MRTDSRDWLQAHYPPSLPLVATPFSIHGLGPRAAPRRRPHKCQVPVDTTSAVRTRLCRWLTFIFYHVFWHENRYKHNKIVSTSVFILMNPFWWLLNFRASLENSLIWRRFGTWLISLKAVTTFCNCVVAWIQSYKTNPNKSIGYIYKMAETLIQSNVYIDNRSLHKIILKLPYFNKFYSRYCSRTLKKIVTAVVRIKSTPIGLHYKYLGYTNTLVLRDVHTSKQHIDHLHM